MTNKFNLLFKIIFPTILLFCCSIVKAQNAKGEKDIIISGQIIDEHKQTVPGASVRIIDLPFGTISDENGKYTLKGHIKGDVSIEFSILGMKPIVIKYTGQKILNVTMYYEANMLNEIVLTARQNINEIDIRAKSGVVQQVDMTRITSKPMIDMSSALQGSVPGLLVTNTGGIGSKPEIRIRGNSSLRKGNIANEPLYVMDGQIITAEAFFELNPADIKDIKVLKDAAACALYGIKAANGVLEISSQRGREGKAVYTYNMDMGITLRGRRGIAMMESSEKLELERLLKNPAAPGYRYSEDYYRKYYSSDPQLEELIAQGRSKLDSLKGTNTDWFRQLIRNSMYQKHNLSMKGGSDVSSYYISANFTEQGGRIPGNDKQRVSLRMNLDQKLGKWGYAMLSVNGGYSKTNNPNGSDYDPSTLVYQLNPYESINGGKLYSYPNRTYQDLLNQFSSESEDKTAGASGSINLSFVPGLDISAIAGVDFVLSETLNITPSTAYSEMNSGIALNQRGKLSKSKNTSTNLSSNVRVTYNKIIAERHNFTIGANLDFYKSISDNVSITGYGIGKLRSASAINQSIEGNRKPHVGSYRDKNAQLGIGIVAGYTFDSVYDIFATYKADASSILPKDKRWNMAWAAGLGWTISKYGFLENNNVISNLNIRASYGKTASLSGVSMSSTVATFSYSKDSYEDRRLLELMGLYNKDLKPEQTTSIDAGISLELFRRINIGVNWYKRTTKEALLDVPIPSSCGFLSLKRNIGVLDNSGYEFTLNGKVLNKGDFQLILGASLSYNKNNVVDLYYADRIFASEDAVIPDYEIGKSFDMIYGPKCLGINPITGLPVFEGADGREIQATETLTREDMIALGHSTPPFSGTINMSLSYKALDFNADFYYVAGGIKQYNYSYVREANDANKNAIRNQVNDMWFKKGDEGKTYHTPFYSSKAIDNLTRWPNTTTIGSSSYFKLSMISLRYRFSSKLLEKTKFIKYANIAFQASNLFTITPYKESNPEGGTLAGSQQPILTLNLSISL